MDFYFTREDLVSMGINVDEFIEEFVNSGLFAPEDSLGRFLYLGDATDMDGDGIPDLINELFGSAIVANPSQGNIGG